MAFYSIESLIICYCKKEITYTILLGLQINIKRKIYRYEKKQKDDYYFLQFIPLIIIGYKKKYNWKKNRGKLIKKKRNRNNNFAALIIELLIKVYNILFVFLKLFYIIWFCKN